VEDERAFSQRYRTAMVIAAVFLATVFVYMLISYFISPRDPVSGSEIWSKPVFACVIGIGLMVVILRRIMLSQIVMGKAVLRGMNAVLDKLMTMTIVCLAVAELVALLGLVLYMLTGDYQYSWRLGIVSIFLILYSFPRRGEWKRAVAASTKAQ
jgi:ABC-type antimicrobial peptide transport system permease subunit